MTGRLTVLTAIIIACLLATVLGLVRRRQLRSKYAMLWVLTTAAMIVLAALNFVSKGKFVDAARWIGIVDGANLFILAALVFLLIFAVHTSWELSRLDSRVRRLAQELALEREASREKLAQPDDSNGSEDDN